MCAFGVVGLVVSLAGSPSSWVLRSTPLTYLGTISFGLYVYHIPVLWGVEHLFRMFGVSHPVGPDHPWWRALLELVLSLGVASLSWFGMERPILAMKSRLGYRTPVRPVVGLP